MKTDWNINDSLKFIVLLDLLLSTLLEMYWFSLFLDQILHLDFTLVEELYETNKPDIDEFIRNTCVDVVLDLSFRSE